MDKRGQPNIALALAAIDERNDYVEHIQRTQIAYAVFVRSLLIPAKAPETALESGDGKKEDPPA